MPELPEVETIKKEILPHVLNRTIKSAEIFWDKMIKKPAVPDFKAHVAGRKITDVTRRGKYLFFHLDSGEKLLMHMKMTGSLMVNPEDTKFTRAVLHLDKGVDVHFRDPRKFGMMWLEKDEKSIRSKLGPEPLDDDFTVATLAQIFKKRTAPVKPVLLDQALIAGIGNMYADEALFESKIHPERPAQSLKPAEVKRLYDAIRLVLNKALKLGGASVRNYVRPDGAPGTAHDEFNVAHGTGKNCPRCGTLIKRIVVRGRGTYLCPKCQPSPK
jgi:formamidopyrimidine-DNA glycosylase